jgi:hypothetical protein
MPYMLERTRPNGSMRSSSSLQDGVFAVWEEFGDQLCRVPVLAGGGCNGAAAKPIESALVALADPYRDVGGFQGMVHDTGQVIADRV